MKIGIFDSGLGGLSVLHCAKKLLPDADYIYYADEKHVPYGEKRPEEIRTYVEEIFKFLISKQVDAIVIACNTATSVADREYRNQFPVPIVGMEPAVKKAIDLYGRENKKILVAATPITINGNKLKKMVTRIDTDNESSLIALPGLVRYAEQLNFEAEEVSEYLKNQLKHYDLKEYGTVVLGCTHFNYFKNSFKELFDSGIHFVDGNEGTIHQLMRLLERDGIHLQGEGSIEYYKSGQLVQGRERDVFKICMDQLDRVYDIN